MKAVLCGTGWRSRFYMRISDALPELLTIVSVYSRTEGRGCTDLSSALSKEHDAVIVSTSGDAFLPLMRNLRMRGERVFAETSFLGLEDRELDELADMEGGVFEQYRYTPLLASMISSLSLLGEVDQLYLSGLHSHHAASIARCILGVSSEMIDEVKGEDFSSVIAKTGERDRIVVSGEEEEYKRKIRILRFGKKLFVNDFSSNQYHSSLYGKRIEIRGRRGIMTERGASCVGPDGYPVELSFVFHRDTVFGNASHALSHVTLGEKTVFENPFYPVALNDDEIAIASIIKAVNEGGSYPTIRDAVEDARIGKLL